MPLRPVQLRTSWRCFATLPRHSESSVALARGSAQPKPRRQRLTSPEGSAAHCLISFPCRAKSARQPESALNWAVLSCSCWKRRAAVSAWSFFQRYCSTRQLAAPAASMVMALQLRTSASFLASDLPQLVAARTQSAVRPGFVQRMGPPLAANCSPPRVCASVAVHRHPACLRTGWDSNPRYPCGHTGFRDRPFQPLTHLSSKTVSRRSLHVARPRRHRSHARATCDLERATC